MKITKSQLKQIIQEELENTLQELEAPEVSGPDEADRYFSAPPSKRSSIERRNPKGAPEGTSWAVFTAITDMAFVESKCRKDPYQHGCRDMLMDNLGAILAGFKGFEGRWDKYKPLILMHPALNTEQVGWLVRQEMKNK
tara:strand:+ start:460 stop:876 length:417 start_codon:yes stop_codon:yes gene_type:complete